MNTELFYLIWVTLFTALLWIPYVLNRFMVFGLVDTVGYPSNPKPLAPWAQRLQKAHANAIENLMIFAPLVLASQVLGISTGLTAGACVLYFWGRVVHAIAYALAIPWVRTLAFLAGFLAQLILAVQLLTVQ